MRILPYLGWKNHGSDLAYGRLPQTALAIRILPEGYKIDTWVIATHLGCDLSGIEQFCELEEVQEFVQKELLTSFDGPDLPHVILCGDFNSHSFSPHFDLMNYLGWKDCWIANRPSSFFTRIFHLLNTIPFSMLLGIILSAFGGTHPSKFPLVRIDFMLFKSHNTFSSKKLCCSMFEVIPTLSSDHLPMIAKFTEI